MSSGSPATDEPDDLTRVLLALHPTLIIEGRRASGWFTPEPEHRGNPGWLHGGMAAVVLDHICARAATAALGERVVTGTLDLRYHQPVAIDGRRYRVEAEAAEPRGRLAKVTGAILDADGRPMVDAKSLFVVRP